MGNPSSSKAKVQPVVPKLVELIDGLIYPDIWERPQLSKRDRSLVTLAALVALRQTDQMRSHMEKGLAHGLTPEEISEVLTHLAFYAGFPASLSAALIAKPLFQEVGKPTPGESDE